MRRVEHGHSRINKAFDMAQRLRRTLGAPHHVPEPRHAAERQVCRERLAVGCLQAVPANKSWREAGAPTAPAYGVARAEGV